ncbi:MAG: alpha/beta hydrolase [Pseudomonadota bacterium]
MVSACLALLAALAASSVGAVSPLCPPGPTAPGAPEAAGKIRDHRFISVGGIEQWIAIDGEKCGNPVILFLHGGPANPLSPYSDAVYGKWAKDFTLVQWDQRGGGKTYIRNKSTSTLTLEQMAEDGIEVANFIRHHLGKQKIILTGSSWGSILGIHMAKAHPELFDAYIGVSQLVSQRENQAASYAAVLALAGQAEDREAVTALQAIGAPPWSNPRNNGILRRLVRRYEAKTTLPSPPAWWQVSAEYASPQMEAQYEEGEEYSYLQFIGMQNDGMYSKVDLPKLGTDFKVPVYFIQGTQDLLTTADVTRRYFDSIGAPDKDLIMVPQAGHDPNTPLIDAQYKLLMERVRPKLR